MDNYSGYNLSEDQFEDDLIETKDGVMVTDNNGLVLMMNDVVENMWEVPKDVLEERRLESMLQHFSTKCRDGGPFFEVLVAEIKSKNRVLKIDLPFKDGRVMRCHTFPMIGSDNKIHGRIWQSRDVTEVKRSEDVKALQSLMMENLAEGVVLVRATDNIIVHANRRFEKIFGYEKGELLGQCVCVLNAPYPDKSPEQIGQMVTDRLTKKGVWKGTLENIKKDGTRIWTEINISKINNSEFGEVWVSIQGDISDRVSALNRLRESEKKFRMLFENSLDATLLLADEGTRVLDANAEACKLFDWTRDELLKLDRARLIDLTDERIIKLIKHREKYGHYKGTFRIIRKDKTFVECEGASVVYKGRDGFRQTHVVLRRISETKV